MFCPKCGDKVDNNEFFCNKCGNKLIETTSSFRSNIPAQNKNHNKTMIIFGGIIGLLVTLIVFGCFYVTNKNKVNYVYDKPKEIVNEKEETEETEETEEVPTRKSKYSTIIVTDNFYSGLSIKNEDDIEKIIVDDSVKQKKYCPQEMVEIENELIEKFNVTAVNLCEMDIEFAKEIVKVFEIIYNEYPSIRDDLTNFSLINASLNDSYIAAFMPVFQFVKANTSSSYPWGIKTQILLNTKYFLRPDVLESSVINASDTGHFPPNATKYSPIAHEFGHYISFLAMLKSYDLESILLIDENNVDKFYEVVNDFGEGMYTLEMLEEAHNRYKNDTGDNIEFDAWRGTISDYALAKDGSGNYIYDETIAEAFHDVYLNGEDAVLASKYVIEVLKERLEGEV